MGWATLLTDWEVRVADSSDQTPSFADRQSSEIRSQALHNVRLREFVCLGDDQNWYFWVQCVKVTVAVGWGCLRYKEKEEEEEEY